MGPSGMPILPGEATPGVAATTVASPKKIRGPKALILGAPGDGKTHSIRTLIEAGLNVFVVFSEPGMEVLLDSKRGASYSCKQGLHWAYIPPINADWSELAAAADLLNRYTLKQVTEMQGTNKEKYRQFFDYINMHGNLKCDRCNTVFGPADRLEPYDKWCLVDDSLTSLSIMALNLVVGSKGAVHQGEYGVAMFNLERFIYKIVYDNPSMGVLFAHVEREGDEVSGGTMNMAATLGRKLAPKIPRPFSDVVHAWREGGSFYWSTVTPNMMLKSRHLPFENKLKPSFAPLVQAWHQHIREETEYLDSAPSLGQLEESSSF